MMANNSYTPPKIWQWQPGNGGQFASINRPESGATFQHSLPQGNHSFQLYSLATPNGVKATIMFEELLQLGIKEAEYDAFLINISEGDQFSSGFVEINPNSKIPALIDLSSRQPVRIFESGSILLYLAEKFDAFLPHSIPEKTNCINWLFWQVGSAPYLGGGFGHFYAYAPEKFEYPINRFTMEVKRQLHLLDSQLEHSPFISGKDYSIADMAIWPWYGALVLGELYEAAEFLQVNDYPHLKTWAEKIAARDAVQRGRRVNKVWGDESLQIRERHNASDFK